MTTRAAAGIIAPFPVIPESAVRLVACLVACLLATPLAARELSEFVPADAPNCNVAPPPATAGAAMTQLGFILVQPRNAAIKPGYTGCKAIWAMENEKKGIRFATLYFKDGRLALAVAHDRRSPDAAVLGVCEFPGARSIFPERGPAADRNCAPLEKEAFSRLMFPTWPRECLAGPKAHKDCQKPPK